MGPIVAHAITDGFESWIATVTRLQSGIGSNIVDCRARVIKANLRPGMRKRQRLLGIVLEETTEWSPGELGDK